MSSTKHEFPLGFGTIAIGGLRMSIIRTADLVEIEQAHRWSKMEPKTWVNSH